MSKLNHLLFRSTLYYFNQSLIISQKLLKDFIQGLLLNCLDTQQGGATSSIN
jgi:hypothetical protein